VYAEVGVCVICVYESVCLTMCVCVSMRVYESVHACISGYHVVFACVCIRVSVCTRM
jgi:hypothetical protein